MVVHLTRPQVEALLTAATAMLAGERGAGDAEGVSFAVLERAADCLRTVLTPTRPAGPQEA